MEINDLKAELATLRASPLPVTAEELAEAWAGPIVWQGAGRAVRDMWVLKAKEALTRLSASRTEAKGASAPALSVITVEALTEAIPYGLAVASGERLTRVNWHAVSMAVLGFIANSTRG